MPSYITYANDEKTLHVLFQMKGYTEIQPKTNSECNEIITYFKTIIDAIRNKFPNHRQIFTVDLKDCYTSDMYSMRYTIKILNDIHQYTKDDKQLDCIILKNTGNVIKRVYKLVKPVLPEFIDELLVIEEEAPQDNQQHNTNEENDDLLEQELAKCIHGS